MKEDPYYPRIRTDLRLAIRDALLGGPLTVNDLHRKLGGVNKSNLTETWKIMEENGEIKSEKQKNRIFLSLVDPENIIANHLLDFNFKALQKNANDLLKKLEKNGSLFVVKGKIKAPLPDPKNKNRVRWKTFSNWGINPKAKFNFQQLVNLINNIFSHSASLTYAEALELVSKSDIDSIKTHQKKCIKIIQNIIKQLVNQNKREGSKLLIMDYLKIKVLGYGQLQQIGTV